MVGCSVFNCKNRFARGKLHFFRFPKDGERQENWIKFTRKSNFKPKLGSTICEIHFTKECFVQKKNKLFLSKDAVPQLYFKKTDIGLEKVTVPFDTKLKQYFGSESFDLLPSLLSAEDVEAIGIKRQQRIEELKNMCCLCFDIETTNSQCVSISMFDAFHINLEQFDVKLIPDEFCGNLVCEQCFQFIVEIDLFKKKCREAQEDILAEIVELDAKIQTVENANYNEKTWHKAAIGSAAIDAIEVVEEHIIEEDEPQTNSQEEYIEEEIHDEDIVYEQLSDVKIEEIELTDETMQEIELSEFHEADFITVAPYEPKTSMLGKSDENTIGIDEYAVESTDDIIKNPERNRFCFRIYECFFCKMKFAGRKTYIAHKCPITEVKCEHCDRKFSKIHAYNSHMSSVHGTMPISKHYCPLCKTLLMTTLNKFKQHRRQCNKETRNQPIECEVCGKMCNNLKGYTIHKLFHDTRNFTTSTGVKIASEGLNKEIPKICEICGKNFNSSVGYRMHKKNVHRVGQAEGAFFQCDVCAKICQTKRSLFDHMRNTHRVQESQCNVCKKVFRTKILLKKHMVYHDETKRIFKCPLCPDKPGYYTNVALMRHKRSHVGNRDFHCDVEECGASYTTNHQLKMHKQNKHGIERK